MFLDRLLGQKGDITGTTAKCSQGQRRIVPILTSLPGKQYAEVAKFYLGKYYTGVFRGEKIS
jgi:hypothetical protein